MPEIELAGGPLDGKRIKARGEIVAARISLFDPGGEPDPSGPLPYVLAGVRSDGTPWYQYTPAK